MKHKELQEAKRLLKEASSKIDKAMVPTKDIAFCHGVKCGDKYSCERYIFGKDKSGWFQDTFKEGNKCSLYKVSTANLVAQTLFITESGEKQYDNFEVLGVSDEK